MTDEEMITFTKTLVGDDRFDSFVEPYLGIAKGAVIQRRYPYKPDATWEDIPEKYHALTCEIAVYLVNRRGAEGETSHSESGVSRSYESAGIPDTYLRGITPLVGVPTCEI